VFEHVFDPIQSAKEVRRVLKDGGDFFIDTAFLQGYHGFPSHYFNMTPQAVETVLCDDFILTESYVPEGAMLTHALVTQFDRFLELIPEHLQNELRKMTLTDAIERIRTNRDRHGDLTKHISEFGHRSLAASFAIRATKPQNYEIARTERFSTPQERAAYYAARMGVIQRHHEVELYRRFASEKHHLKSIPGLTPLPHLSHVLNSGNVKEPHVKGAYQDATKVLKDWDATLTAIRDEAIVIFLSESFESRRHANQS
jgi:hypothetical protein